MELLPKLNESERLALRKYRVWIRDNEDRFRELTPQQREYYQDLLVRDWYYDRDQREARHRKLKGNVPLIKDEVDTRKRQLSGTWSTQLKDSHTGRSK